MGPIPASSPASAEETKIAAGQSVLYRAQSAPLGYAALSEVSVVGARQPLLPGGANSSTSSSGSDASATPAVQQEALHCGSHVDNLLSLCWIGADVLYLLVAVIFLFAPQTKVSYLLWVLIGSAVARSTAATLGSYVVNLAVHGLTDFLLWYLHYRYVRYDITSPVFWLALAQVTLRTIATAYPTLTSPMWMPTPPWRRLSTVAPLILLTTLV